MFFLGVFTSPFWTANKISSRVWDEESYLGEAILICIQWIKRRKVSPNERRLTATMYYFLQSFREREAVLDDFQESIDLNKSSTEKVVYKEDFWPDVLVANTRVIKSGHNCTRGSKLVMMEPDYSAYPILLTTMSGRRRCERLKI